MTSVSGGLLHALRPWWFPLSALAAFEWYARTLGKSSEALAPPSAALRALGIAMLDGSLLQATAFTLGSAALGLLLAAGDFERGRRQDFAATQTNGDLLKAQQRVCGHISKSSMPAKQSVPATQQTAGFT